MALVEFALSVLRRPPFKVPAVSVMSPEKVCVRLVPKFSVPPDPLIVSAAPLTAPVKVAVPPVFVMETAPVVVNPAMLWAELVPATTMGELPAVNVPALTKSPWKVRPKLPVASFAPVVIFKGTLVLFPSTLAAFKVMVPVPLTITPPDPKKFKKIKLEDIEIGVPIQQKIDPADLIRKGTVTFFNESKGYGFIKDQQTQESIFVHINGLKDKITENSKVTFEVEMGHKGPNAVNVKIAS